MQLSSRAFPSLRLLSAAVLAAVAACSGGSSDGPQGPAGPGATTGSLAVTITGLPGEITPSVVVTGPGGYSLTMTGSATVGSLTPGAYTITPARTVNVGLAYVTPDPAISAQVTAGGQASAAVTYALRINPRSTANRTDENALSKYRIMYVLPSDGVDRNLDTDGTLVRSISSWQRWYATQTAGRSLRLDLANGAPDIVFARIAKSDAVMMSYGDFIRDTLEAQLAPTYGSPNTLLLVYYDGGHQTRCGSAAYPPALPGVVAAIFLKGLASSSFPCSANPFAASPTAAPGYIEFVAAHESLHLLGIVSPTAPNYSNQHVGNDPTDLMYAGSQPWQPSKLDATKTNYYNAAGLPVGIINLSVSPFLVQQ